MALDADVEDPLQPVQGDRVEQLADDLGPRPSPFVAGHGANPIVGGEHHILGQARHLPARTHETMERDLRTN